MAKLIKTFLKNFKNIEEYYNYLKYKTKNNEKIGLINETLIDNYSIIFKNKNLILQDQKKINKKSLKTYYVIKSIVTKNNYNLSFNSLIDELNKYQNSTKNTLSYEELTLIKILMPIIYIEKLNDLCHEEYIKLEDKHDIFSIINSKESLNLRDFIPYNFDLSNNFHYIYEINNQIKNIKKNIDIFKSLNEYLKNNKLSLKEIINEEYHKNINSNLLMKNIINSLKNLLNFSNEELFEKVCYTEKLLLTDKIYCKMTVETKISYRNKLIKLAKINKISTEKYLESILNKNEHIGNKLFKETSYSFKPIIYMILLIFLTIILTTFLSNFFIKPRYISFLILFLPTYQLLKLLINFIKRNSFSSIFIPKMDFSKKIPLEYSTMVVITSIIKSKEEIKEIFDNLESYYLINKSNNIYFSFLADPTPSQIKIEKEDKELAEYGKKYANELNKKYKNQLFFFLYRRRLWNSFEKKYVAYEGKKGALSQFNKILLNEDIKELKNFYVNMLDKNKLDIKYVINLSKDIKLTLNSINGLIGAMAHPLNSPILNSNNTKVIKGYGIMQPTIINDFLIINKNKYNKITNNINKFLKGYSNFYLNLISEESFYGYGIYDLKIFDKILTNDISNNKPLLKKYLDTYLLRCGKLIDVELVNFKVNSPLEDSKDIYYYTKENTNKLISFLTKKNKLNDLTNTIGILDQTIQIFSPIFFLLIIYFSFVTNSHFSLIWILFIVIILLLNLINTSQIKPINNNLTDNHFENKYYIIETYIELSKIPYYAYLYLNAFFRSIFKTKNTFEFEAKNKLSNYLKQYLSNFIFSIILIIIALSTANYFSLFMALIFISSPFILFLLNKNFKKTKHNINDENIKEIAFRTWKFFEDNLREENNYLIKEYYNEINKDTNNNITTPTNIGFSLTSIINAYNLHFITLEKSLFLIEKILDTINSLPKWNGLLYSKYSLEKKVSSNVISSISTGVFLSCLIVTKEFLILEKQDKLVKICDKIINNTDLKKLINSNNQFSIGYDVSKDLLIKESYDYFASEALLLNFVAISLGHIDKKQWFNLDRTIIKYNGKSGLLSKEGTAIEYFLPHLFLNNYSKTLLNENYKFALFCQKEYINKINRKLPWGLSKSSYSEINNFSNIQMKSFSVPFLKIKEDKINRIVISPYSSLMVIDLFPLEVSKNIHLLKNLNLYDKYGFFEAFDYDYQSVVKSFYTDHLGMSLIGLTNYLGNGVIQQLFHNNINIKTYDILLKEKNFENTSKNMKILKYLKYNYQKENIENNIRKINNLSNFNELAVISNRKYSLIMDNFGNSFSKYRNIQLNRYRENTKSGVYLFIKDTKNKNVWSNTYEPLKIKPDFYEVVFATNKLEFLRKDSDVTTKTEIIVCKNYNAEIRKITFKNNSNSIKELELTTYIEPLISELDDDIFNKNINNMFITTIFNKEFKYLLSKRKNYKEFNSNNYIFTQLIIDNPIDNFSYETERSNFIGRNNSLEKAIALDNKLSNYAGDNIDPIMSIRNKILVPVNDTVTVYLLVGYGRSKKQISEIVNFYSNKNNLENAFEISRLMSIFDTKALNLTHNNLKNFNSILNFLYQSSKISITEERMDLLRKNTLGQTALWKYGISGDRKIILVEISDINDMSFIYEILKAYEYFKSRSIYIDIIILNNESSKYLSIIKKEIEDELYKINSLNDFYNTKGSVIIINNNILTREEHNLLNIIPNLKFIIENHSSLETLLKQIQNNIVIVDENNFKLEENIKINSHEELVADNGYGGFKNNGKEYFIYNPNTEAPWSNVIANKKFGTIITNNGCGYTYAFNSREYKISSNTNENVLNLKSEGFKFNKKLFDPTSCTHGFGYSILASETKELKHSICEFIALEDSVKLYLLKIKNKQSKKVVTNIEFFINPVLGNNEEKASNYILTEFQEEENSLNMRNVYSVNYNDINVFMTSSEKINSYLNNTSLLKSINININLAKEEEKTIVFVLGASHSDRENNELIEKYSKVSNCLQELEEVKSYWNKTLEKIQINTPDYSFDYVINGWYLYQTFSSRIMAKASFYKNNDTYNFRNYLEDALNLVSIDEDFTKNQILESAKHQFVDGEVLHWWNEKNHFGLRSRYKDDYLWLPFTVIHYLEITSDYSILNEKVPYTEGENLSNYEIEKGIIYNYSENKDTILNHCLKAIELAMNSLGKHKLPLIGCGDCDEKMNNIGIKGKGESAYLGFFLYHIIDQFTNIIKKSDKNIDINIYKEFNLKLKENLHKKAWDKDHYIRAFYDNGDKLGSFDNKECQIDLISQSYSIISNVATKEQINKIIATVKENLVDSDNKIIKNFTPAFKNSLNNPGIIMNYPINFGENGGQSTKFVAPYLLALLKTGYYNQAYQYFQMINPINRSDDFLKINSYKIEPYVLSSNISADDNHKGQGSFSWLTGAASWFYRIAIEEILGLNKRGNILKLTPKIPNTWDTFKIVYKYKKTTYNIEVIKGEKENLELDGKIQLSNNSIELKDDSITHFIKLYIKK